MSQPTFDNPPAFPCDSMTTRPTQGGMLLRDWFAGQALRALLAGMQADREEAINNHEAEAEWEASLAYRIADAMLTARTSTPCNSLPVGE